MARSQTEHAWMETVGLQEAMMFVDDDDRDDLVDPEPVFHYVSIAIHCEMLSKGALE